MKNICILCSKSFLPSSISAEQKLIKDTDFCHICWEKITQFEIPS